MSIFRQFRWASTPHPVRVLGLCVAMVAALIAGGCANPFGLPTSGSVRQLSPIENQPHRVFSSPEGPADGAGPESIVRGFIAALPTGIQSDGFAVAKSYMTKRAFADWDFNASVSIYRESPVYDRVDGEGSGKTAALDLTTKCVGSLDAHGIFSATDQDAGSVDRTDRFELAKVRGQWRISKAPAVIVISSDDFLQVYRQVVIYQFPFAKGVPVPDNRWFGWRNWRTLALKELLKGPPAWLGDSVTNFNTAKVSLAVDAVQQVKGRMEIRVSTSFASLSNENKAMLVHQMRMLLGDGNGEFDLRVVDAAGIDYSHADDDLTMASGQTSNRIYSLGSSGVVGFNSSNLIRVGQPPVFHEPRGLVFSSNGGALLSDQGLVTCLKPDASSCGKLFADTPITAIAGSFTDEVWAVRQSDSAILVDTGKPGALEFNLPWLHGRRVVALAVAPEGQRLCLVLDDGLQGMSTLVMLGIVRGENQRPKGLSNQIQVIARHRDIKALTFYNDNTLVYKDGDMEAGGHSQIAPGPEMVQHLPAGTTDLAAGQVNQMQSLIALDRSGIVHCLSGALEGMWYIIDSQVDTVTSGR